MADLEAFLNEIEEIEKEPESAATAGADADSTAVTTTTTTSTTTSTTTEATASKPQIVEVVASSAPALNPKFLEELAAPFIQQRQMYVPVEKEKRQHPAAPAHARTVKEQAPDEVVYAIHGAPVEKEVVKKKAVVLRTAAGETWEDKKLQEWPAGDYRLFVGNLAGEVRDEQLSETFKEYPSMHRVRVIRDAKTDQSKGFGFVGFTDPFEMLRAMREKQGKLCGSRPMQIKQSKTEERDAKVVKQRQREKHKEERKLQKLAAD